MAIEFKPSFSQTDTILGSGTPSEPKSRFKLDYGDQEKDKKSKIRIDYEASKEANTLPENSFIIGDNPDGSKKYSFDTIYEDKELIKIAKNYYENRGLEFDSDRDVVDEFISDRTWKQANISSALKEAYSVATIDDTEQLKRLGYLTDYWNKLPNFWEEGGRNAFSAIWNNVYRGVLDWTNLASLGVGSVVTKTIGKEAVKGTTTQLLKKEIAKRTAIATGATVGFDAAVVAGADVAIQKTEQNLGLRNELDFKRTGLVALTAGGISILPNGFASYAGVKYEVGKQITKNVPNNSLIKGIYKNIGDEETATGAVSDTISTKSDSFFRNMFDMYNPFARLQKTIRGVGKSETELLGEYQKGGTTILIKQGDEYVEKTVDPISNPYFMFRLLTGSTSRGVDFAENGVMLPPELYSIAYSYTATGNKGINAILRDFDDVGEAENLLTYLAAKRTKSILENYQAKKDIKLEPAKIKTTKTVEGDQVNYQSVYRDKNFNFYKDATTKKYVVVDADNKIVSKDLKNINEAKASIVETVDGILIKEAQKKVKAPTMPMTIQQADAMIDWVEMAAPDYFAKYGTQNNRNKKLNYKQAADELVLFFDDLLEYQRISGILSPEDIVNIKANNPFYIPFYGLRDASVDTIISPTTTTKPKIRGISAPAKKRTGQKKKTQINPFYASSLDYLFSSIVAGDRNRAKMSFYDLIDEGIQKGTIKEGEVVKKVSPKEVGYATVLTKDLVKKLNAMGIKIDADNPNLVDNITTAAYLDNFKSGDRTIDVVYRNGKAEFYEIVNPALLDLYSSTSSTLAPFMEKLATLSRIPARAITYSPPFVAFNWIRDSLSATVNSAFGFIPIGSSLKGFFKTFGGENTKRRISLEGFKNFFRRNDEYRKALVSGMGFASRAETERMGVKLESYGSSIANAAYKKSFNNTIMKFLSKGARGYIELVGRVEYASRLAQYNLAKKSGFSEVGAAFAGREVSTDFGMRGTSKVLDNFTSVTMFLNAGLQGFYRGARILKENPVKAATAITTTIVLPEVALWSLNNGRPEWEELPDEIKQLNYTIPIFKDDIGDNTHLHGDGTKKIDYFFLVPKPYDFGIFANIATAILEGFRKNSPPVAFEYAKESLLRILPGWNEGTGVVLPTLVNPWVNLSMNTNWLGDPIVPINMQDIAQVDKNLVFKTNTRETAKKVAEYYNKIMEKFGAGVTPITIDYIMNSYFTGMLSYPLDIADSIVYDEDTFGERPDERTDRADLVRKPWTIVTRRFNANTPVKNSKNLQKLYEIYNKGQAYKAAESSKLNNYETLLKILGTEEQELTTEKAQEYIEVSDSLYNIMQSLKDLRDSRIQISLDKYLSAEEKRIQIDEIIEEENIIARAALYWIYESDLPNIQKNVFGFQKDDPTAEAIRLFGGE